MIKTHEQKLSQYVGRPTPGNWIQLRPVLIEMVLLMALYIALGFLLLDQSPETLYSESWKHVLLLVSWLAVFGAYRFTDRINPVRLFTSFIISFIAAGTAFLICVLWVSEPTADFRFIKLFLAVAFFMLNSIRPLIYCSDRW